MKIDENLGGICVIANEFQSLNKEHGPLVFANVKYVGDLLCVFNIQNFINNDTKSMYIARYNVRMPEAFILLHSWFGAN